jgi:hypothetical protein
MAQSYLGQEGAFYAERQPTDYIDWSKISSDLSKTLDAEAQRRTELKAFLDEENRLAINKLQESPQGEHKGANQFALEYADNGSKYLLMLNKMLKSGQMSVKDYTVAVQNIKDGTNDTFSMLKEYQANFKEIMDRAKNGDNQALELYTSSQIEGYGDFNKSQIYIDPSSGRVSIAMKDKKIVDGKEVYVMTENPNQIATVSSLRGQLKARYDKFNVDNATDLYVQSLGKEIESVKAAGGYMNISDVTAKDDFYKAETDAIHAMLTNPLHNSSILTESKKFTDDGKQYGFTYDRAEAEKDPSKILLRLDPSSNVAMPDFESTANGRKQMEIATEWVRTQARTKYDKETRFQEVAPPRARTQAEIEEGGRIKSEKEITAMVGQLWGGSDAEVGVATTAFRDFNPNIKKVKRTPEGVELNIIVDGKLEQRTIPFSENGKLLSQEQFIRKAVPLLTGIRDVESAIKRGGYIKGAKFNPNANTEAIATTVGKEETQKDDYTNEIRDYVNTNTNIVANDPTTTVNNLKSKFPNFRFSGKSTGMLNQNDFLTIIIPGKGAKDFPIDNLAKDLAPIQQYLEDNMDKSVNPMPKPKEQPTGSGAAGDDIFKKK